MAHIDLPAFGWTPRDYQIPAWQALRDQKIRTVVLAWARRHGKDELALHNTAISAIERVGTYWHLLPIQEQARKAIWEQVNPHTGRVRWKEVFPAEMIEHVDNQSMKLTFKNNSVWQVLGSNNHDGLVGTAPVGVNLSEAALADPAAFGFIRPILLENGGWSTHISSVRGRNHFYEFFRNYQDREDAFTQLISAEDTGLFTPEQLAMERRDYINTYGAAWGNSLFEQEYLSSWDAAVIGAVFGIEMKDMRNEGRIAPFGYDPRYPVYTSWDIGVGDPTYCIFWQIIGNRPRMIDWYMATDTGVDHYAEILASKPYYYAKHIGPHDVINRGGGTATSWYERGKQIGIHFERMPNVPKGQSIAAGSNLVRMMEANVEDIRVEDPRDDCGHIIEALTQYRFKFDKERKVMSKVPVHDWTSHPADAVMTFGLYLAEQRNVLGRPSAVQGRGMEIQKFDQRRLRDIMGHGGNRPRGAFG